MAKAFILVLRKQKKGKVFVEDLKKVIKADRRHLPPIPSNWNHPTKMPSET